MIFTIHTHKEPPKVPVYSYHCIHVTCSEKTLPKFSQGQETSQVRWNFSNESHIATKKMSDTLRFIRLATI